MGKFLDMLKSSRPDAESFVLGNAKSEGIPVVYSSEGFYELTGYRRSQICGKGSTCSFLHGPLTKETAKQSIEDALQLQQECKVQLCLYTKSGEPFWCGMEVMPITNEFQEVVLFLITYHKFVRRETVVDVVDPQLTQESFADRLSQTESTFSKKKKRGRQYLFNLTRQFKSQRKKMGQLDKQLACRDTGKSMQDYQENSLYFRMGELKDPTEELRRSFDNITIEGTDASDEKEDAALVVRKVAREFQEAVSGQQAVPEYKVEIQKKSRGIILHYGFVKVLWDWLIMLCTFYIAVMVPFNAAFIVGEYDRTSIYADVAVEIIFGIDIVLNFRTTYVSDTGQVVYDPKLIALNYIRQWFLMDLLAAIPFDLLYAFQVETGTLIPLLKVARLLRLIRLFQKMDRYSQYASVVIILLLSMFTLTAHWLACIWYSVGKFELHKNPPNLRVGWLYDLSEVLNDPIVNKTNIPDMWNCYLTALYFTCSSLTTVGFGNVSANTNAEKIFSICVMLVGAMMYALVFGNVTAIVQRAYARRATFHIKTNELKDFYHTYNIPKPLKHRIQEYFQSMWTMNNGINFNELFCEFPEEMRGEISMHLYKEILSLPLFECVTQGCLKAISLQIRRSFCVPGEFIIHRGDAISYLYFILTGSLEILRDGRVIALIGKGDLFGIDLQFDEPISPSSYSVKSLTYCEIQCLSIMGFINVLSLYPTVAEKLAHAVQRELTFNLKDSDETEPVHCESSTRQSANADNHRKNIPDYWMSGSAEPNKVGKVERFRLIVSSLMNRKSDSQEDKKDVSKQNYTERPSKVNPIIKTIARQKTIQDTLKRKIQTMRKDKQNKEEETRQHQHKMCTLESMQTDINSLSKEMTTIHKELRSAIELLCNFTHAPKEQYLCPLPEQNLLASRTPVKVQPHNMELVQEEPTSNTLTITSKDFDDITSETGVSEVTPEDAVSEPCLSEEYCMKDNKECKKVEPLAESSSKMEEAGYSGNSGNSKEAPTANKTPHISVIFEPNIVKVNCPANSTADISQKKASQETSGSGTSASKSSSNSSLPLGLTDFPSKEEESGRKHIVTETTNV